MYDFSTLSPLDFEDLVRDLLQADMRIRLESFGPGSDQGIDFRFSKGIKKTIVQAKHYGRSGASALAQIARKETAKVKALKPSRYILATSVSMNPKLKARVQTAMPGISLNDEDILGQEDLNNLLGRHPDLERKHFKLWLSSTAVLERILQSGVYNQTTAEMAFVKSLVPKFVQNESVGKSEQILERCGTLVISGHPGVGKTTLARMLLWLHAEQNWRIAVISDIREAFEVSSEGGKTLIYFDDFLGQVRLSTDFIRDIDRKLPSVLRRIRAKGELRFILTTRDYILRQAQAESSNLSSEDVIVSEFVLDVGSYTRAVRARILFNHVFFADISDDDRASLLFDDFFIEVIDHPNFNPRLIDSLVSSKVTGSSGSLRERMQRTLDNPEQLWELPYRAHVSPYARILLLAMFFHVGRISRKDLEKSFIRMAKASEVALPRIDAVRLFRSALKEIEGSFLSIEDDKVDFANPGVRDCMWKIVEEDGLAITALDAVTEFHEVLQAWAFFKAQKQFNEETNNFTTEWLKILKRLHQSSSGTWLQRLLLMLEIAQTLDQSIDQISKVLIAESEKSVSFSSAEMSDGAEVLQQLHASKFPQKLRDALITRISFAARNMLLEEGGLTTLDDLGLIERRLTMSGVEPAETREALKTAYSQFAEYIETELEAIDDLDDLEEFEDNLLMKLTDYGIDLGPAQIAISERRDEIEDEPEGSGYTSSRTTKDEDISDDAIRSLFRSLRKS